MQTIIRLKRGSDFRHRITLPELADTYTTITCKAQCVAETWDIDVRLLDESRRVELHAAADVTAEWPLRLVACDLRLSVGGEVAMTETFLIQMLPEVTGNG